MKKLESKINITASRQKVWDTMLGPETYKKWVNAAWPGSYYEGNWREGENIKFISPGQGGTLATLIECRPYEFILAKHIAVITSEGAEDRDSDAAKSWIGTTESYTFTENNGVTELKTVMKTNPEWEKMLADWPKALAKLKEICES
jgi:hypothetical protein